MKKIHETVYGFKWAFSQIQGIIRDYANIVCLSHKVPYVYWYMENMCRRVRLKSIQMHEMNEAWNENVGSSL